MMTMSLMVGCAGVSNLPEMTQSQAETTAPVETLPEVKLDLENLDIVKIGDTDFYLEQLNLSDLCYNMDTILGFVSSSMHNEMGMGESVVNTWRPNTMDDPYNYPPSVVIASQTERDFIYAVRFYYRDAGRDNMELKRPEDMVHTEVLNGVISGITPEALDTCRSQLLSQGWVDKDGVLEGVYTSESGVYWVIDICADETDSYITWYKVDESNSSNDVDTLRAMLGAADEQA